MKKIITITLALFLTISLFSQVVNKPGSGECVKFSGSGFIQMPNISQYDFTNDFTIECWSNFPTVNYAAMINTWVINSGVGYSLHMLPGSGLIRWCIGEPNGGGFTSVVSANAINVNEWHHFVGQRIGGQMKLFIDGVEAGSAPVTTSALTPGRNLEIGRLYPSTSAGNDNFLIDEVRLWNYARTQTQIRETMCQKLVGNETGLSGYWRMDEGLDNSCSGGEDVCDVTVNGNNGVKF